MKLVHAFECAFGNDFTNDIRTTNIELCVNSTQQRSVTAETIIIIIIENIKTKVKSSLTVTLPINGNDAAQLALTVPHQTMERAADFCQPNDR